jgi:hypothetical protein
MAQYRFGKASLANGARVVSFVGATLVGNVEPGNLFSFAGENVWYQIVSVDTAASTATLNSDYTGASKVEAGYAIHRDFTSALRMPTLSYGDTNTAGLLQQSFSTMDAAMKTLGAQGGALTGIASPTFTLQRGMTGEPGADAGLIIERGDLPTVSILWDELAELWTFGGQGLTGLTTINASGKISGGSLELTGNAVVGGTGAFTGNVTAPKFIGALQGNADSATKFATARSIALSGGATAAGVNFDGSSNITLDVTALDASTLSAGTVAKARLTGSYDISVTGNAATATKWATARNVSISGGATAAAIALDGSTDIALDVTALDATKLTGTIDKARLTGTYDVSVSGNAATASKLAASRKISVGGDVLSTTAVTTNGDFDGSVAITIDTQLKTLPGLTAGSYSNLTIDNKGRVTAIAALSKANVTTALGFTPLDANGGIITGSLTVTGDLTVQGDTITLDVGTVSVEDAIIQVAKNNSGATLPYAGLKVERGGTDAFLVFNESTDRWTAYTSGNDLASAGTLGDIEAATFYGELSGNASTATTLKTSRNISISGGATASGVSFNGSSAITLNVTALDASKLTGTVPVGSIAITTDNVPEGQAVYFTTARARASVSAAGTGLVYDPVTGVFTSNATAANTNGAIVARDGSGNFSAGTITAALQGNAASATKLATARTINGKSFDGTADVTLTTSDIAEGTNLYYTDARATNAARAAMKPGPGITYDPATGTITSTAAASTVLSVAGRAGDVVLTADDLTDATFSRPVSAPSMTTGGISWKGTINGDYYEAVNAAWNGTSWNRLDATKPAWLWQYNVANNMIYEGYRAVTFWVAQPGVNPIGGFTAEGGWFMVNSNSEYKDFTIGGNGVEVDGNFTVPYGRFLHATIWGVKQTGILTNVYLDASGRDDTTKPSFFAGFYDDGTNERFKIRRGAPGASLEWTDHLDLDLKTGEMVVPKGLRVTSELAGVMFSHGGSISDQNSSGLNNAGRTIIKTNNNSLHILSEDGATSLLTLENGVLATTGGVHSGQLFVRGPYPIVDLYDTNAAVDQKNLRFIYDQGAFYLQQIKDDGSSAIRNLLHIGADFKLEAPSGFRMAAGQSIDLGRGSTIYDNGSDRTVFRSSYWGFLNAAGTAWAMSVNQNGDMSTGRSVTSPAFYSTTAGGFEAGGADHGFWMHYPGVRRARWKAGGDGRIYLQDQGGGVMLSIGGSGDINTTQFGDLYGHIENRGSAWGAAHAANRIGNLRYVGHAYTILTPGQQWEAGNWLVYGIRDGSNGTDIGLWHKYMQKEVAGVWYDVTA